MEIGPIVDASLQSREELKQREQHTHYLISQLLDSSLLRASEVGARRLLYRRYKKLLRDAVVAPLATFLECPHDQILSNPASPELMAVLIREAWEVTRHDLPGTKLEDVQGWVGSALTNNIHPMVHHVIMGEDTGIEKINGWLIERARQMGLKCPTHQKLMEWVIAKTMENRKKLYAIQREHHEQQVTSRSDVGRQDEALPCKERPDRLEVKRENKRQRQLKRLGNQPMPARYAKPQISSIGKTRIRDEAKGSG